ncbi:uncharacterized protein LOC116563416 [Sapajus apella]|uniref:Uncharacterized protein LOC116563416 n=1 Tax=Sapajus apella TaxID=9515 RepID=A0A6J3JBX1_SAPAP|nr:uncharacterized protein LOC116563416 [Sapajus apella]
MQRKLTKGFVPRRPFPACAAPHSDRGLQCAERSAAFSSRSWGSAVAAGGHRREIKPLLPQQNGSKSNQSLAFSCESRLCLFGSPSRVIPGSVTFLLQGALCNSTGCAASSRTRRARPGRVTGECDVPGKADPLPGTTVPDQRERALSTSACTRGRVWVAEPRVTALETAHPDPSYPRCQPVATSSGTDTKPRQKSRVHWESLRLSKGRGGRALCQTSHFLIQFFVKEAVSCPPAGAQAVGGSLALPWECSLRAPCSRSPAPTLTGAASPDPLRGSAPIPIQFSSVLKEHRRGGSWAGRQGSCCLDSLVEESATWSWAWGLLSPYFSTRGDGQRLRTGLQPQGPNYAAAAAVLAATVVATGSWAPCSSQLKGGGSYYPLASRSPSLMDEKYPYLYTCCT